MKKWCIPALIVLCTGCASTKTVTLPDETVARFNGKTLTYVSHEKPSFSAMTAGKAAAAGMFGAIGGAVAGGAMVSAGNKIINENEVADPAGRIGQSLAGELALGRSMILKDSSGAVAKTNDAAELVKLYGGTDYLLDAQTTGWGFMYFPTNWSHYKILYSTRMRLIETSSGKVLAEGLCSRGNDAQASEAPTHDEMLADRAALLKQKLGTHADSCIDEFRSQVLKL